MMNCEGRYGQSCGGGKRPIFLTLAASTQILSGTVGTGMNSGASNPRAILLPALDITGKVGYQSFNILADSYRCRFVRRELSPERRRLRESGFDGLFRAGRVVPTSQA